MKNPLILFIISLFLLSCEEDKTITFEPLTFENKTCEDCPLVEISVPHALGNKKIDETINTAIREELIFILKYDDEINVSSIDSAIVSFKNEYKKLKQKFPEESTKWEAKVTGEVSYENDNVLTVRLDYFLFTGGAHGYSSIRFLNFDKTKAREMDNVELFKDLEGFKDLAETVFRKQENIPPNGAINSTGFMFEDDTFYLPENMGFTKEGLQLFYEQYEVASYADGPIVLAIPYDEAKKYLGPFFSKNP